MKKATTTTKKKKSAPKEGKGGDSFSQEIRNSGDTNSGDTISIHYR